MLINYLYLNYILNYVRKVHEPTKAKAKTFSAKT